MSRYDCPENIRLNKLTQTDRLYKIILIAGKANDDDVRNTLDGENKHAMMKVQAVGG